MLIWRFFSGNLRRFRRICEHTQSVVSVVRRQPLPPASPRAARRNSTNKSDGGSDSRPQPPSRSTDGAGGRTTGKNEVSDSSSCNSDVSHGIEPNSKNGPSSNVLTVPSGSSTLGTSAVEATATSVTSTAHHENKASPSVATQKVWHYFLYYIICKKREKSKSKILMFLMVLNLTQKMDLLVMSWLFLVAVWH